jgi:hypothetical protein
MTGCTVTCLVLVRASVVCREFGVRKLWLHISESGSEQHMWCNTDQVETKVKLNWLLNVSVCYGAGSENSDAHKIINTQICCAT